MGTKILQSDLARDALYTKVNQIGDEKVDLESDQTISGRKTFTNDITIKNDVPAFWLHENDAVKGTNPQNEEIWSIYNQDNTNNNGPEHRLGLFATHLQTNGTVWSGIQVYKNVANSTDAASIRVYYPQTGNPYTYAPNPTDTSSTSSQQIATVGWVNNPATSTNVVHRTGNETISGVKTFTYNPYISNVEPRLFLNSTDVTRGTAPSANEFLSINFQDANNDWFGYVQSAYNTDKSVVTFIGARKSISSSDTASVRIGIGYDSSGNPYTSAPTPSDTTTTSGTQIATTGWVNSVGNNAVHKTGNETIAGTKTFSSTISGNINGNAATVTNGVYTTGNQTIAGTKTFSSTISGSITGNAGTVTNGVYTTGNQTIGGTKTFSGNLVVSKSSAETVLKNTAQTKGTAPSGDLWGAVEWQDSAGKTMAKIRQRYTSAKTNFIDIMCYKANSSSDTTSTSLQVVYPASGDPYMNGVTPAVSDSSTKLATTAYINNKFKKVSTLPASPDANTFYFIPE